ncbi:MAG: XRE family transcriptional regulator [Comamonadaceae bacterium]|nr:MAG: XRE family transcriptional regulator [Comamonadaceae bacterium]
MPQVASAIDTLPSAASAALRQLGADLATARKRRKQPLRAWAARMDVSVPTLMRMEKGDPAVSIGVYATALWIVGRHEALAVVAEPKEDVAALENEISVAARRHRRQEPPLD